MAKRKNISGCVFLLLLLMCSNGRKTLPVKDFNDYACRFSTLLVLPATGITPVVKQSVFTNRIKIRYKGGECPAFGLAAPFCMMHCAFAAPLKESGYVSYIAARHYFLFKLRGPPAMC